MAGFHSTILKALIRLQVRVRIEMTAAHVSNSIHVNPNAFIGYLLYDEKART
jgi:hypothetical protein